MKHKIWIVVAPQILRDLINTLYNCKATFEVNVAKCSLFILDMTAFTYDSENKDAMYRIQINTENNTKDIFIAEDNMYEFTVHFG